jgi:hypothetical protein
MLLESKPLRLLWIKFTLKVFEHPGTPTIKKGILFIIEISIRNTFYLSALFIAIFSVEHTILFKNSICSLSYIFSIYLIDSFIDYAIIFLITSFLDYDYAIET